MFFQVVVGDLYKFDKLVIEMENNDKKQFFQFYMFKKKFSETFAKNLYPTKNMEFYHIIIVPNV